MRKRNRPLAFELLEDRVQPVVDVTADITANTTWLSGETYRLTGTRSVRNGAMLTIQSGAIVSASSSFWALQVANDTSSAGISADGVTFNANLNVYQSAQGQIQNSTFNSPPTFDFQAGNPITIANNQFLAAPFVDPEAVTYLPGNTFAANTVVNVLGSRIINSNVTWPSLTNVTGYRIASGTSGNVLIRDAATLTIANGVTVSSNNPSFYGITVSDNATGGGLVANTVDLNVPVSLYQNASSTLTACQIRQALTVDADANNSITLTNNQFSAEPFVHPEFVSELQGNTFVANTVVNVLGSRLVNSSVTWPNLANVGAYKVAGGVSGNVQIRDGATLTLANGVTVNSSNVSFYGITASDNSTGGGLVAGSAILNLPISLYQAASATITNSEIRQALAVDADNNNSITITNNQFFAEPFVHPEFVSELLGNTFVANTVVNVLGSRIVNSSTTWPAIPNVGSYKIAAGVSGDVTVRDGATLTLANGITVNSNNVSFYGLTVSDNGTGGGLVADAVILNLPVELYQAASASISNSQIRQNFTIDADTNNTISVANNQFTAEPYIHPESASELLGNTFGANTVVNILGSRTIDSPVTWPAIPNVGSYKVASGISGNVAVRGGGTLTIASGLLVNTSNTNFYGITVSDNASGGTLNATGVRFNCPITFDRVSQGSVRYSTFMVKLTVHSNFAASIRNNTIGTTDAIGSAGTTINLSSNWWGTTDSAAIEALITHQPDNSNRPLVVFQPILTSVPVPPAATISGTVYRDTDGNGTRGGTEPALSGWTVYLDANNNGSLEGTELSTATDANGIYQFTGLEAGNYTVREIVEPGFQTTAPVAGSHSITLASNTSTVSGRDFGNQPIPTASIAGTVFRDNDSNGTLDGNDQGQAGWTVFLDTDNNGSLNGAEPSTTTNAQGQFLFTSLHAGSYVVREVLQANYTRTVPASGFYNVTLTDGQAVGGKDFGNFRQPTASIAGTVYQDDDANGQRNGTEAGLAGWIVYLDANNNSILDGGESQATTGTNGDYLLGSLPAGTFQLRQVPQLGYAVTEPGAGVYSVTLTDGEAATGKVFGNKIVPLGSISGAVFFDENGNGIRDANEVGQPGWAVFLDANDDGIFQNGETQIGTDALGNFTFTGVSAGVYHVREVVQAGYTRTLPLSGKVDVTLATNQAFTGALFGNRITPTGLISGSVFNDVNGDTQRNVNETGLGSWTVFVDLDQDGTRDGNEPVTTTSSSGGYTFSAMPGGVFRVVVESQAGFVQTTPGTGYYQVTLANGQAVSGVVFGYRFPPSASVSGVLFRDDNSDGIFNGAEPPLVGWTVYLDANRNNTLDATEARTTTDAAGVYQFSLLPAGSYRVNVATLASYVPTLPSTGSREISLGNGQSLPFQNLGFRIPPPSSIVGVVFRDNNKNGARDTNEPFLIGWVVFLDANRDGIRQATERATTTDSTGTYRFLNLSAGTYRVRHVVQAGFVQTSPALKYHDVILAVGQNVVSKNFSDYVPPPSSIAGIVYHDVNGNGRRDSTEKGMAGATVYLDINRDGLLSRGEPKAVTDSKGVFRLLNLSAGSYRLREVPVTGYAVSAPSLGYIDTVLAIGQNLAGRLFGNRFRANVSLRAIDGFAKEFPRNTGMFEITRTGPTTAPLTVQLSLKVGLGFARSGTDFLRIPSSITFAKGVSRMTILVDPVRDLVREGTEKVVLSLVDNPLYVVKTRSATVSVQD